MAETSKTGLLDLQKELTCSICTEILYQPLTLLDCLHTFCGSCLKGWFTHQATRASGREAHPYTCPACRANVRETRPNATVTTLLDMFLKANPASDRTAQEKEEMNKVYKSGENVIPKVETSSNTVEDEDRRMVEEIREMSLRDVGVRYPRSYERGVRHRNRGLEARDDEGRQRRRRDAPSSGEVPSSSIDSWVQARQIEHQSSLRSLLSASDIDSAEMEEAILRQIMEEGLLDGIDLNNLDVSQEDEISERIAEAYRRRHGRRSRSPPTSTGQYENTRDLMPRPLNTPSSRRQQRRSFNTADQSTNSPHPPISRPQLFETPPAGYNSRRRTSSESRRQTAPPTGSPVVRQEAARSATDLSDRQQTSEFRGTRPSNLNAHGRRSTDPRPRGSSESMPASDPQGSPSVETRAPRSQLSSNMTTESPIAAVQTAMSSDLSHSSDEPRLQTKTETERRMPSTTLGVLDSNTVRPSSSSSTASRSRPVLYPEPSISCDRCGKRNLEYDLHKNCSVCNDGNYNLCYRCYRLGRGCLHWYGFGEVAWHRFQQRGSPDQQLPHMLVGHRYLRPRPESIQPFTSESSRRMTSEDPAGRLQSGGFCSSCFAFANNLFWKCDHCNEGEWGYCNRCVNQGKCCTHPLLPLAHGAPSSMLQGSQPGSSHHSEASFAPMVSPGTVQAFPTLDSTSFGQYEPLTFSTKCDICRYPIPPSHTRFHCYECNDGDYDICNTSYHKLIASGRISRENGDNGWRRCLRGHRMVLVGFQDSAAGQLRVVVRDLVGGHTLKDEGGQVLDVEGNWTFRKGEDQQVQNISKQFPAVDQKITATAPIFQKFPPDGGVGMVALATYSYLPDDDAKRELSFPRGAEIREMENINPYWFWGVYAGVIGIFPANYVQVLHVVTM